MTHFCNPNVRSVTLFSACAAEGVDLPMDCQEFCDRLSLAEFQKWAQMQAEGDEPEAEKKTL